MENSSPLFSGGSHIPAQSVCLWCRAAGHVSRRSGSREDKPIETSATEGKRIAPYGREPGAPDRILIVRLSSIGDVVVASPLIGAFRRTWPRARISWLVEEASRPVLEHNAELHELIVWPRQHWRRLLRGGRLITLAREWVAFLRHLREQRFDLAVDAQGLLKSGLWAFLSGAPERVGIGSREGSRILMTRVIQRSGNSDRVSSQYLLLAEALGLNVGDFPMEVAVGPDAEQFAARLAASLPSAYVALCPFTTRPQKHWIEDHWRELSIRIADEHGLSVILLGGPGDRASGDRILSGDGDARMVNMAGRTTIQEAAAIIERAALVIGVDTGLTHMGFALGVPTVALFGATRPYLTAGLAPGTVIYHPMECSPCRRTPTCDGEFPCMGSITVEEVLAASDPFLEGSGQP
ncbi:MAG: glycosyltransferase family 9 protein [bacterium]|nr:MAG: glycosyltransferase family 9 protein [bacterium]